MKYSILVARRQTAIEQIVAETRRLGGSLTVPAARGDGEHQQLALLEAIAEALAAIGAAEGAKPKSGKAAEVEPVEAIISVVKEPEDSAKPDEPADEKAQDKPAPKKRGKS